MKLIVLSSPTPVANELAILTSMFENGLNYFHLRKPAFDLTQYENYLSSIPDKFHDKIMLHTYHDLQHKFDTKGIHFSGEPPVTMVAKFKDNTTTSISCHSFEEVKKLGQQFSYVFVSPIFDSISKIGYKSTFDPSTLKTAIAQIYPQKLIALGGINANNIKQTGNYGFDGVGVLGAIWMSRNPLNSFINLRKQCLC